MASEMQLDGITILDASRLFPGPYATQLLTDLGAEVIKVEEPDLGDYARYMPPKIGDVGAIFSAVNRGKKSVTINLQSDAGQEIFYRLASEADVVFESFKPGTAERLGIDYNTIQERNKGLIYCSLSGYGQDGPYSDMVGHDLNYVGLTGFLDMTRSDGDSEPAVPGFPLSDMAGGMMAALRIVSALLGRSLGNNDGKYLDVSLAESVLSMSQAYSVLALAGRNPRSHETLLTGKFPCYDIYETADGKYLTLAALEPKFWENFCRVIERPEWIERHLSEDVDQREQLNDDLTELFGQKSREEWESIFSNTDAMVAPVLTPEEVVENPHFQSREGIMRDSETRVGLFDVTTGPEMDWPGLGEHTEEILSDVGYDSAQMDEFANNGII